MLRKKTADLEWLEFELLQEFPTVRHGVFLHVDLGYKGQLKDKIRVCDTFGVQASMLKQVHGEDVIEIKAQQERVLCHDRYDGMLTQTTGIGLLIRHADCQSAIFYDPIRNALANVHCGWRGSVRNIYKNTVQRLQQLYGSHPEDLRVCIGPSLGPQSAEFKHYKNELPQSFWAFQVRPHYFDFWAISRSQLIAAGVQDKHIEIAEICTYASLKDCYSYRRNPHTPHHGTLVSLTSP